MPWKENTTMSQKQGFILQAKGENRNISALCREYGISRKTGYKWLKREAEDGVEGLVEHSRKPHHSPNQTQEHIEERVLAVRKEHPAWGGRKIRKVLLNAGYGQVPAASTITAILHRESRIDPTEAHKHKPYQRFEKERPNELWQMDFKGYFRLEAGGYCHPLTVLDDHSRFLIGLRACANERFETVQTQLIRLFRQFGLPERMLMDNGSPWGDDRNNPYTVLTAWLIRLNIAISHCGPHHPQTQGKDERLHRSLKKEVLRRYSLTDLDESQLAFDDWWYVYNYQRPHEALGLDYPGSRYQPSSRPYPETLPPVIYMDGDHLRKVDSAGRISFANRVIRVGKAFRGFPVAVRPSVQDGIFQVFFCAQPVAKIDLKSNNC
ncbi:MAG TPA: IS481 family transposase [Bellilinea sp.]|nr:IS481 family transposase [Bellilinea sp.]